MSILATADREEVIGFFEKYDRVALPVTDSQGVLLGIITVDDVLDVAEEEATEDIQRLGGMEALEAPYLDIGFTAMLRKRVGWLTVLFFGQMFTATAMAHYQDAIAQAVFLSSFVPLIISSGGNSGSQATSLIIRALAVRDVSLADWWRVALRESTSGIALGVFLERWARCASSSGPGAELLYGPHFGWVGIAVGFSVVGVVTFGTLCGSMLPVPAAAPGVGSGRRVRALRGHAGGRHRRGHLLHRGEHHPRRPRLLSEPAQNMWRRMLMFTSRPTLIITDMIEEPP